MVWCEGHSYEVACGVNVYVYKLQKSKVSKCHNNQKYRCKDVVKTPTLELIRKKAL